MKVTTAEVATQGSWTIDGTTYSTPAVVSGAEGKTLTIELQMTRRFGDACLQMTAARSAA